MGMVSNSLEKRIIEIIEPDVVDIGFELVSVRLKTTSPKVLEILIDKLDNEKVSVGECQKVSQLISALLDVEDIIEGVYHLEVSSSGAERLLVKFENYIRFSGREVKIKLNAPLNGRTRYQGKIIKAENNAIYLQSDSGEIVIDYDLIKKSSLVLTDEMFKELLKQ